MGDLAVVDVDRGGAAVVWAGGGLDLSLAEDHGPGLCVAVAEESRGARRGAFPLDDEGPLIPIMGHLLFFAPAGAAAATRVRGGVVGFAYEGKVSLSGRFRPSRRFPERIFFFSQYFARVNGRQTYRHTAAEFRVNWRS